MKSPTMENSRLLALPFELRSLIISYVVPSTIDLDDLSIPICGNRVHRKLPYCECSDFGLTPTCRSPSSLLYVNKQLRNEMVATLCDARPEARFRRPRSFNFFVAGLARLQRVKFTILDGGKDTPKPSLLISFTFNTVLYSFIPRKDLDYEAKHCREQVLRHELSGYGASRDWSLRSDITTAAQHEGHVVEFGAWSEELVRRDASGLDSGCANQGVRLQGTLPSWLCADS